jgi:hypothetical protein
MASVQRTWQRANGLFLPSNNINPAFIKFGGVAAIGGFTHSTLLRTRFNVILAAAVGSADPPPERWWTRFSALAVVNVSEVSSSDVKSPTSQDERIVLTCQLQPTLVASPSAPGEYYVTFKPQEGTLDSRGQRRHENGVGAGFWYCSGIQLWDYESAVDGGIYSSIDMYAESYIECLTEYDQP